MTICQTCGVHENMPFSCRYCGGTFCSSHRLPENHTCSGLQQWGDPLTTNLNSSMTASNLLQIFSLRRLFPSFNGNLTYLFIALMWVTFIFQWIVLIFFGIETHNALFTASTAHPEYVWTWISSIFAHSPFRFSHILLNSIALYFFGPSVERYIGPKRFFYLFIFSGVLATLAQIGVSLSSATPSLVLGASGAIMSIMGFLTVLNPHLKVYLYFFLPIPLWILTIGFAILSLSFISIGGFGAGGVAQLAHLTGLLIGIFYGEKLKRNKSLNLKLQGPFKPKMGI